MKKLLSLTLLAGLLLAITGCVDRVAYSRRSHYRSGYHDDRRATRYYEARPVYRGDRRVYDDGYYGRRDVRVYDAPRAPRADVRVVF